jgi:hypothetical protein
MTDINAEIMRVNKRVVGKFVSRFVAATSFEELDQIRDEVQRSSLDSFDKKSLLEKIAARRDDRTVDELEKLWDGIDAAKTRGDLDAMVQVVKTHSFVSDDEKEWLLARIEKARTKHE